MTRQIKECWGYSVTRITCGHCHAEKVAGFAACRACLGRGRRDSWQFVMFTRRGCRTGNLYATQDQALSAAMARRDLYNGLA